MEALEQAARVNPGPTAFMDSRPGIVPVLDLSLTHARLLLAHPVEVGDVLTVQLLDREAAQWRVLRLRVVEVSADQDGWVVEGTFLQELAVDELDGVRGVVRIAG
jgi:hypothetical protein